MNLLLDRFPKDAQERWHDHSQVLDLDVGAVVAAPGAPMEHVYFPMNCMFVVQNQMPNGKALGVALVGREGVLGLQALLGTASDNTRAAVLVAGRALRLSAGALRNEFERGGAAQQLLLAYLHIALTHFAQAAFCNRFHSLEGQLCMRLLQMVDMTDRSDFQLTQAEVAELLGTRRETVNQLLGELKDAGIVASHRNGVAVTERNGLWRRACECHGVLKDAQHRLLGQRH
jgi:CRP-like cAMP-binding protein